MLRDSLNNALYWDAYIFRRDKTIARFEPLIIASDRALKDRIGFAYDVYMATFRKSIASYSAGHTIDEMKKHLIISIYLLL
jgi:hypothetical protein